MKNFLINTCITVASVVIALLLGEAGLRLLTPTDPVLSDPILGNVMRPGGEYDARGWRNADALSSADIVALGDSQTQGNNAPTSNEAWPQVLGHLATSSVYQMALGGYGPVQYGHLLDNALSLHPKVVIVGFYLGNDLTDTYRLAYDFDHWKDLRDPNFVSTVATSSGIDYRTLLQTGLPPDSLEFRIYQIRLYIRAHSRLYALLGDATRSLRERVGVAHTKEEKLSQIADFAEGNPDSVYVVKEPGIETILSPGYRLDTVSLSEKNTAEGWRIAQGVFRKMAERLREKETHFVLLVIPTKEGVYLDYLRHKDGAIPESFTTYDRKENELAATVKDFCVKEKIDCVFALSGMSAALTRKEPIYGKTFDGHPTSAGYRVIAEMLLNAEVSRAPTIK